MYQQLVKTYFERFGPNQVSMAASTEALDYCIQLINKNKYESILDAGSGLSSVLFHSIFPAVKTIDDDPAWANLTKTFIEDNLAKAITISSINEIIHDQYDFVFCDLGDIETRLYYFKLLLHLCKKAIYVDDMHIKYFREYVKSNSKGFSIKILESETKDEFGRFGALLVRHDL